MRIQWTLICALLFAFVTAIFAVINVEPVRVNFLFAETNTPLILVILSSTLLGGLIVGLFGIIRQYKMQRTIRQLERQLREAQSVRLGVEQPKTDVAGNEQPPNRDTNPTSDHV